MKHEPLAAPPLKRQQPSNAFQNSLAHWRCVDAFDPAAYCNEKIKLLAAYFSKHRLDACVVAISGGVDSAVVLGLMALFQKTHPHILRSIKAVTMPASFSKGVTGQTSTLHKTNLIGAALGVEIVTCEMTHGVKSAVESIERVVDAPLSPWAEGQEVPYMRTAWLYGVTAGLSDQGFRAVLMGTTNKDEGSHLGFFGKASDGMVDVQPISDLHKSQVFALAKHLRLPSEIVSATPTGDMFDGRVDEDVFGASYDEVEWAIRAMERGAHDSAVDAFDAWTTSSSSDDLSNVSLIRVAMQNIDALHRYNAHKYIGGSPAVHLDLLPCFLSNGWKNNTNFHRPLVAPPDTSRFVNYQPWSPVISADVPIVTKDTPIHGVTHFRTALSTAEILAWRAWAMSSPWARADQHGRAQREPAASTPGSWRKTTMNPLISRVLYERLCVAGLPPFATNSVNEDLTGGGLVWSRVGLNNVWRWIRYDKGDALVPHYDDTFQYTSHTRTLMSVLIYLTDGATRFLTEPRQQHSFEDLPHLWDGDGTVVHAKAGDVLVFDHRLLHDSPIVSSEKLVIRTDVVFSKPSLGGAIDHH
jgi:NAD+ synthetase